MRGVSGNARSSKFFAYYTDISNDTCITVYNTYGSRHISSGYSLDRCVQVIKRLALDYLCADFTADTECGEATLDNDKATRLVSAKRTPKYN